MWSLSDVPAFALIFESYISRLIACKDLNEWIVLLEIKSTRKDSFGGALMEVSSCASGTVWVEIF